MSVASILADGRAAANARMTELVRVGPAVDGVDEQSGDPTVDIENAVYGGSEGAIGQIKYVAESVSESAGTGQSLAVQRPILKVPYGSPILSEGDAVVVVSSNSDQILDGRWYRIAGAADAGQTTAHKYPLIELS